MMKRLVMFAVAAGMFIYAGDAYAQCSKPCGKDKSSSCSTKKKEEIKLSDLKSVTKEEVAEMIKVSNVTIVDARDENSFTAGHIDGAINYGKADLPTDKNANLVFYCGGLKCPAAAKAAKIAAEAGYKNVMVFRGGWAEWSAANGQI